MADYLLPGRITSESEFTAASGACGPTALSAALRWAKQDDSYTAPAVMRQLQEWGLCDSNGVTNTPNLRAAAEHAGYGFPVQSHGTEDILGFATHFFDPTPRGAVILELANGQALKDTVTGDTEDATNLHYHFICLVGYNPGGASAHDGGKTVPAGFWACDGDSNEQNPIIDGARVHRTLNTDLQYYTVSDLAAAQPYDAFALMPIPGEDVVTINLSNSTVAYFFEADGSSWKCKQTGHIINAGAMLNFYVAFGGTALCGLTYLGLPISDEVAMPGKTSVTYQRFERGALVNDAAHAYDGPPSAGAVYLAHLDNGQPQADYAKPLTAPLAAQLAQAQADLADAKNKLAAETTALTAEQAQDASDEQKLADAQSQVQQLDGLVQQLQAKVDALTAQIQNNPPESDTDKQAIAALINLDAAIVAAKKASGL